MVIFQRMCWIAPLALVVVAVVAGCDRPVAGAARPAPERPSATHTTTSPPTTTALVTAADGTNYAACATRTCEISVSGPVDITIGGSAPGTLSVTGVHGDAVDFTLTLDDGESANGTLKPGCDETTLGGGSMSGTFGGEDDTSCATQPPSATPGTVTFVMPSAANGVAVIWIAID